jgi:hypothetical protein
VPGMLLSTTGSIAYVVSHSARADWIFIRDRRMGER